MDDLLLYLLWLLAISGAFALLGLAAEGIERFCDWFDDWQRDVFHNYADEP